MCVYTAALVAIVIYLCIYLCIHLSMNLSTYLHLSLWIGRELFLAIRPTLVLEAPSAFTAKTLLFSASKRPQEPSTPQCTSIKGLMVSVRWYLGSLLRVVWGVGGAVYGSLSVGLQVQKYHLPWGREGISRACFGLFEVFRVWWWLKIHWADPKDRST